MWSVECRVQSLEGKAQYGFQCIFSVCVFGYCVKNAFGFVDCIRLAGNFTNLIAILGYLPVFEQRHFATLGAQGHAGAVKLCS